MKVLLLVAEGCPHLESFYIDGCEVITDVSMVRLAEGCPNLQNLDLSFCYDITVISIVQLAEKYA
jgi:hypothetical protein